MLSKVIMGCDPEVFVGINKKKASAHDLLPGTKKKPFKVPYGAVQVDGTAAEFNIDPAKTLDEWHRNITSVLSTMENMMREKEPSAQYAWTPARFYSEEIWKTIPDSAKEMGCDPDLSAYTGQENPRPSSPSETLRSAGGHVHIGWTKDADIDSFEHKRDCRLVVLVLDKILYDLSTTWDNDETRRSLYGKPGAYRIKPYGVEYRTLSNMWVNKKKTREMVYFTVQEVMKLFRKPTPSFITFLNSEIFKYLANTSSIDKSYIRSSLPNLNITFPTIMKKAKELGFNL